MATQQMQKNENRQQSSGNRQSQERAMRPMEDIVTYAREFAREQPEMAALWCLGIGFVLGWKLKPW